MMKSKQGHLYKNNDAEKSILSAALQFLHSTLTKTATNSSVGRHHHFVLRGMACKPEAPKRVHTVIMKKLFTTSATQSQQQMLSLPEDSLGPTG